MKIITIVVFFANSLFAQQMDYYLHVNQAEELFVLNHDARCFKEYQKAFRTKAHYFAKDAYIAAQIAYYLKDEKKVVLYLKRAFELGLPFTALKSAPIFQKIETTSVYPEVVKVFQQCKKPTFDAAARDTIYQKCFISDSLKFIMGKDSKKIAQFNQFEDSFRDYLKQEYLSKGIFPNENLIGIATDSVFDDFMRRNGHVDPYAAVEKQLFGSTSSIPIEYGLVSKYSFSVLLHSSCSFPNYQKFLFDAVMNGYLQPIEYGLLHETSIAWNQQASNPNEKCTRLVSDAYYNILEFDPRKDIQTRIDDSNTEGIKQVEKNRASIGMQKYSIDQLKRLDQKNLGLKFFFYFLER
ncbi:MAG: hypothetical protein RL207_1510 [Bacteroidota bacterium]|jgi:hypothetical protein